MSSMTKRVEDLERQIGYLSNKISDLTDLLENFFGVRRSRGVESRDPVLMIYQLLREYIALEKARQVKLTELTTSAESASLVHLLELFKNNLPADERELVSTLGSHLPTLIESLKESSLFEELKKAKEQLAKATTTSVQEPIEIPETSQETQQTPSRSKRQREELSEEEQPDPKKGKVSTSQKTKVLARKPVKPSSSDTTELERLLQRHGVSYKSSELSSKEKKLKAISMLPDRDLTDEDKQLIFHNLYQ